MKVKWLELPERLLGASLLGLVGLLVGDEVASAIACSDLGFLIQDPRSHQDTGGYAVVLLVVFAVFAVTGFVAMPSLLRGRSRAPE